MMTKREKAAKAQIMHKLFEEGYGNNSSNADEISYAKLFSYFDLNLTSDPQTVAYCVMSKAVIVVNENLDIDQVSFVIRHEILHEFLDHLIRFQRHTAGKQSNLPPQLQHMMQNIAADYELSNRGYTEKDKRTAKNLKVGENVVQGLVTDIDHPEWVNLSMEEIYDELTKMDEQQQKELEQLLKNNPQLDQPGDPQIQATEAVKRMTEIMDEVADELDKQAQEGKDANGKELSQEEREAKKIAAKKLKHQAGDFRKNADKLAKQIQKAMENDEAEPIRTPEEVESESELNKKVSNLKKLATSEQVKKELEKTIRELRDKDDIKQAERNAKRYKSSETIKFLNSLNSFIKKETEYYRDYTWKKFDKNTIGAGLLKKGKVSEKNNHIPLINIYFDHSGSWRGRPDKIKAGDMAIASMQKYVRQGLLKLRIYYFSDEISTNPADCTGGNSINQEILDHIVETKADNVIILTDSDINYGYTSSVTVDGAVWFLFADATSPELEKHLHGKKLTQSFFLGNF